MTQINLQETKNEIYKLSYSHSNEK